MSKVMVSWNIGIFEIQLENAVSQPGGMSALNHTSSIDFLIFLPLQMYQSEQVPVSGKRMCA